MRRKCAKLKFIFGMVMAFLFVVTNNYTVLAGTSSPSTVSIGKPGFGIVALDSGTLNVRKTASMTGEIITSLPNESFIMIVGTSGNFYKVQYDGNGHYGFVSKDYVEFWYEDYYLKVKNLNSGLNMRETPDLNANVITSIPANTSFAHFYDVGSSWYCGLYGNKVGSVYASYVDKLTY